MIDDLSIVRPGKPTYFQRIQTNLCTVITKKQRKKLNFLYDEKIQNKNFTIIASFCGGGTLYHDIGMPFLSPTINLAFDGPDFCEFCENLDYYLHQELVEYKTDKLSYPVGRIADKVEIRFVHYNSFEEAKRKWDERIKRINWERIIIISHDRDGMGNDECLRRFDKLKYKKILFSAKKLEYEWAVYCPCFSKQNCVGVLTGISNLKGQRYYERYIDLIDFINK